MCSFVFKGPLEGITEFLSFGVRIVKVFSHFAVS